MAVDQWQDRVEALEGKVTGLQSQLDLRTKELAYLYIHSNWTLIPSGGGAFEVIINGDLVYSKKDNGRHAEPGEVLGLIQKAL